MPATISVANTLDWARTKPSLTAVLGNPVAGYGGNAIAVRIANKVLQDFLSSPFNFKWNRRLPSPFFVNQLQQDYCTSITDVSWLEDGLRYDMATPLFAPPSPPTYPTRGVEVVRELLPCSIQGIPRQMCWIPNAEAICGTWAAGTLFVDPSTVTTMPVQPLTQITDSNGNIQVLTTFGTTGSSQPTWNTTANGTTADGSCVWTMADPNGIAWRLSPLPLQAGNTQKIQPIYQKKPPIITSINNLWTVPDELSSVYETGFCAYAWDAAEDDARFQKEYALFLLKIKRALQQSDREEESFCMYPGRSLTGYCGNMNRGDAEYPPGLF